MKLNMNDVNLGNLDIYCYCYIKQLIINESRPHVWCCRYNFGQHCLEESSHWLKWQWKEASFGIWMVFLLLLIYCSSPFGHRNSICSQNCEGQVSHIRTKSLPIKYCSVTKSCEAIFMCRKKKKKVTIFLFEKVRLILCCHLKTMGTQITYMWLK